MQNKLPSNLYIPSSTTELSELVDTVLLGNFPNEWSLIRYTYPPEAILSFWIKSREQDDSLRVLVIDKIAQTLTDSAIKLISSQQIDPKLENALRITQYTLDIKLVRLSLRIMFSIQDVKAPEIMQVLISIYEMTSENLRDTLRFWLTIISEQNRTTSLAYHLINMAVRSDNISDLNKTIQAVEPWCIAEGNHVGLSKLLKRVEGKLHGYLLVGNSFDKINHLAFVRPVRKRPRVLDRNSIHLGTLRSHGIDLHFDSVKKQFSPQNRQTFIPRIKKTNAQLDESASTMDLADLVGRRIESFFVTQKPSKDYELSERKSLTHWSDSYIHA